MKKNATLPIQAREGMAFPRDVPRASLGWEESLKLILGHAESWVSDTGKEILDSLRSSEQIVLTFVDEFHQGLSNHWEGFRQQMKLVPGQLRGRAIRGFPTLGMTATATKGEIS